MAASEYNNDPHIEAIFTDEMIQWCKLRINSFRAIVGTWDVAYAGAKNPDFNAVRVWGLKDGRKYLIDCFVRRSKIKAALDGLPNFNYPFPFQQACRFGLSTVLE